MLRPKISDLSMIDSVLLRSPNYLYVKNCIRLASLTYLNDGVSQEFLYKGVFKMSGMDSSQTSSFSQIGDQASTKMNPDAPKSPSKIKNLTFVLATLGIVPFFICALGIATHVNQSPLLLKILLAYSALIITFLCGTHWGVAIIQDSRFPKSSSFLIIEGVTLALAALGVFLFIQDAKIQIAIFAGILTFFWIVDILISFKRIIPLWFLGVRTLVTILVVGLLALTYVQEKPMVNTQAPKTNLKPVNSQIPKIPSK